MVLVLVFSKRDVMIQIGVCDERIRYHPSRKSFFSGPVYVHATAGGARGDVIERAVTRETTGDGRHVFGGLVLGERFSRGWVEDLDVALHGTAEDAVAGGGPDGAEREDPATGLVVVFDDGRRFGVVLGGSPHAKRVVVTRR